MWLNGKPEEIAIRYHVMKLCTDVQVRNIASAHVGQMEIFSFKYKTAKNHRLS